MCQHLINLSVGCDDKPLISDLNIIQGITNIKKKKLPLHNTTQLSQQFYDEETECCW